MNPSPDKDSKETARFSETDRLSGESHQLDQFPPLLPAKIRNSSNEVENKLNELSFVGRLVGLFRSVFGSVEPQAQKPHRTYHFDKAETSRQIQKILVRLERERSDLSEEFPHQAAPFIKRHIEPHIHLAENYLERFSQLGEGGVDPVSEVGFVMSIIRPDLMYDKIINTIISHVRDSVNRDLMTLLSYQSDALDLVEDGLKDALVDAFRKMLIPLYDRLERLVNDPPGTSLSETTIRDVFIWKQKVDEFRYSLTERGFVTIDSILREFFKEALASSGDDEELIEHHTEMRLQEIHESSMRCLTALPTFSLDEDREDALFLVRSLREEFLEMIPHAIVRNDLKHLLSEVLESIQLAEQVILTRTSKRSSKSCSKPSSNASSSSSTH